MSGYVTGGWNYVLAAWIGGIAVLASYAVAVNLRLRAIRRNDVP